MRAHRPIRAAVPPDMQQKVYYHSAVEWLRLED